MSVSLYYRAKREYPISVQEQEACRKIVERYNTEYPLGDMYEGFCIYDLDGAEHVIFEGATKLPIGEGTDHFTEVYDYWADCLQEIINLLSDASWYIHVDDADVTPYFDFPK